MLRIEMKAEKPPTKEQIKEFKKEYPEAKIRFMKEGKIFLYLPIVTDEDIDNMGD
jgi:hypothetical protein